MEPEKGAPAGKRPPNKWYVPFLPLVILGIFAGLVLIQGARAMPLRWAVLTFGKPSTGITTGSRSFKELHWVTLQYEDHRGYWPNADAPVTREGMERLTPGHKVPVHFLPAATDLVVLDDDFGEARRLLTTPPSLFTMVVFLQVLFVFYVRRQRS